MADNNPTATVGLSKIIIPFFDPDSKSITPRAWLSFVEMARKSAGKKTVNEVEVLNWTDEVTCTNAILLLRGTAAKWIKNMLVSGATELTNWGEFKKSFKRRFVKSSMSNSNGLKNSLRISSLNIRRGLNSKEEELILTIQDQNCDVCSLSEVDIEDFDEKKPFSIEGYKTFFPLKRTGTNTKRLICFVKVCIEAK